MMLGAVLSGPAASAAEQLLAQRSTQQIYIDGRQTPMEAYSISGSNYVKLRDIGKVVGKNAMIYDNVADAQKAGTQAIAMVAAIANTDFKLDDVSDTNKNKEYENKYGIKKAIAFALEDGPKVQNFPDHHNVDGTSWYFLNSYYIQRMVMDCGGNLPSIYTLDRLETELGKRENVFSGHKIDGWKLLEKMAACGDNARLYKNADWLYSLSDNKVTVEDKNIKLLGQGVTGTYCTLVMS